MSDNEMRHPAVTARPVSPARASSVGERLRALRTASGLTQTELAGERFSKEYVSQIERGKTRPTEETIAWLAERLGVDAAFLAQGVSADVRARVEARLERVDIAEDLISAEATFERLVQPPGVPRSVVAPVADEGGGHQGGRSLWSLQIA